MDLKFDWTSKIFGPKIFLGLNIFGPKIILDLKFAWTQNFVGPKFFGPKILLDTKTFWTQNFFWPTIVLDTIFFGHKLFWTQNFFGHKSFCGEKKILTQNFFGHKFFLYPKLLNPRFFGPAGRTSWTDQLDRAAGQTSSLYFKPWPVRIFEDWPFSLNIVAASESDEGLVYAPIIQYIKPR